MKLCLLSIFGLSYTIVHCDIVGALMEDKDGEKHYQSAYMNSESFS